MLNTKRESGSFFVLSIAMILNGENMQFDDGNAEVSEFDFIAPDAEVLIVDDNAVNLTVAEGLHIGPYRKSLSEEPSLSADSLL